MIYETQPAQPADAPAIETLLDQTFGLSRRTKMSYRLREGNHPVDGLSHVVHENGFGLVGTISFWPLRVGMAGTEALLLGPLAVHPQRQNLGIGLQLMRDGLRLAQAQEHRLVLLVGDEPYYARVGFKRIGNVTLLWPGPINQGRMLFLELVPGAMEGISGLVLPPHRYAMQQKRSINLD
jgi:predicted N-acetyltransferase YhbS